MERCGAKPRVAGIRWKAAVALFPLWRWRHCMAVQKPEPGLRAPGDLPAHADRRPRAGRKVGFISSIGGPMRTPQCDTPGKDNSDSAFRQPRQSRRTGELWAFKVLDEERCPSQACHQPGGRSMSSDRPPLHVESSNRGLPRRRGGIRTALRCGRRPFAHLVQQLLSTAGAVSERAEREVRRLTQLLSSA